jgi:DNA-binding LacI/PurR family transcriptional regulator
MHDVAKLAGVSQRTVSNVVNDFVHVAPETRERVKRAIDALDYRPHVTAQNLRRGRTGILGLALPELGGYFAELAELVQRQAHEHDVTLLIDQTGGGTRDRELLVLDRYRSNLIDGLILHPLTLTAQDLVARDLGVPIVLLGERIDSSELMHVSIDNVAAAREATEHLISLGRRRVAAVGAPALHMPSSPAIQRHRGYLDAMGGAGLPVARELVIETDRWSRETGRRMADQISRIRPQIDGVFCFNDLLALGLMRGLADLGVRVPDDIAVVGWDDIDDAGYANPRLTSIAPDKQSIAVAAIRGVLQLEPLPDASPDISYVLRPRQSTTGIAAP